MMTMAEKILARASGRNKVSPGDYVTAKIDVAQYKAIEWSGPVVDDLSLDGRLTMSNMSFVNPWHGSISETVSPWVSILSWLKGQVSSLMKRIKVNPQQNLVPRLGPFFDRTPLVGQLRSKLPHDYRADNHTCEIETQTNVLT